MTLNLVFWEQSMIRRIFLSFDSSDTERNHVHRNRNKERERCLISRYRKLLISPLLRSLSVCILKLDRTQSGFCSHKSGSGPMLYYTLLSCLVTAPVSIINHPRSDTFHKRPPSKKLHLGKSRWEHKNSSRKDSEKMKPEKFYLKSAKCLISLVQRWKITVCILG